jgi:hypothetical protein
VTLHAPLADEGTRAAGDGALPRATVLLVDDRPENLVAL